MYQLQQVVQGITEIGVVNDPYEMARGCAGILSGAIDLYGQIRSGGIEIINPDYSYTDPQITIIPDQIFHPLFKWLPSLPLLIHGRNLLLGYKCISKRKFFHN